MTLRFLLPVLCFALAGATQPPAPELPRTILDTTYTAPTGSTAAVNAGGNLQSALDNARPGDEIVIEAGATFTGNFVLPSHPGDGWITIRSSKMESLPGPGSRVRPGDAAAMPKLVTIDSRPALATAAGAHHYRIIGLEFVVAPKVPMNYAVVALGDNGSDVNALATDIILDRVYVHGSVLCDCKEGIALNSRRSAIIDSYIAGLHATGLDTQAILGWNGPGPFKIVNNYLEASGENIMFGGAVAGVAGVIPSDIEFHRNYLTKPLAWRGSIIPKPSPLSAAAGGNGALAPGTYYYTVAAAGTVAQLTAALSDASDELSVTLAAGQNSVTLSWPAVRYGDATDARTATEYRVYRTADAPAVTARKWVSYKAPVSDTPAFTDTGTAGDAIAPRAGQRWVVKNLFEIKNAQRVLVDGNVMEYVWQHAQTGYAILCIPRVEGGKMPQAVAADLTFTNNVIRHAGGGMTLGGYDTACTDRKNPAACVLSSRVAIRNNLFDDVDYRKWGGKGWGFYLLDTDGVAIANNTTINTSDYGFAVWLAGTNGSLSIADNIFAGNVGGDGKKGQDALAAYAPGATFSHNVVVAGGAKYYDAAGGNAFPATWDGVGFVSFGTGDYRLGAGSPYKNAGDNGPDPGVPLRVVQDATRGVTAGVAAGSAPVVTAVRNAASLADGPVAPGSLIFISADKLPAPAAVNGSNPVLPELSSVSLSLNDIPAPILAVDEGRLTAQVPFELAPGPAMAVLSFAGAASEPYPFEIAQTAPGIFLTESGHAFAWNPNGTPNDAGSPAAAGGEMAVLVTGQGAVKPETGTGNCPPAGPPPEPVAAVTVEVGGVEAKVLSTFLAPGSVGLARVQFVVPDLPAGDYPITVRIGNAISNTALISIG